MAAVESWQSAARLSQPPLSFTGPQGELLGAVQHVGVVEVGGCAIEIFPKLDAALIDQAEARSDQTQTVMERLLWMLQSCGYMDLTESDAAHLRDSPMDYFDLFAYLMARNLLTELERGVTHEYVGQEDDLQAVRGRLNLTDQLTRNWNRYDRVACKWDEFSADTPMNRVFKCACRILQARVHNPAPAQLLDECCVMLEAVADISVRDAAVIHRNLRWNRSNDRFQRCFEMAARMLSGSGYQLGHGEGDAFVFLLDMNDVFERFVASAISAHFGVAVREQETVGYLFPPNRVAQIPDFRWDAAGHKWIGDAKYKHVASGQVDSIVFDSDMIDEQLDSYGVRAENVLLPADVRQLTVYAEISREHQPSVKPPHVAVFYPFVGRGTFAASKRESWNGSEFWVIPVLLNGDNYDLKRIIPALTNPLLSPV